MLRQSLSILHLFLLARQMSSALSRRMFVMDRFGLRQFTDPTYLGTKILGCSPNEFADKINDLFETGFYNALPSFLYLILYYFGVIGHCKLIDGYAPFCKHLFVPNFVGAKCDYELITESNNRFIECGYASRQSGYYYLLIFNVSDANCLLTCRGTSSFVSLV
jgi:hypothetical protein